MTCHPSHPPVSALRERMIEDMTMRGFGAKTRHDYVRHVRTFAAFIGRSPDTATAEEVRRFQVHQTATGVGAPSINSAVSALRFLFSVTLERPDLARRLTVVRQPRRIPVVLSPQEVARLLEAAPGRSTRRRSPRPMAPGCASPRWSRSRSALALIARLRARVQAALGRPVAVVSCYEAGYDGFWLHRLLEAHGVRNHVLDPASVQVNRRARRAKTDRIDAASLLRALMAYRRGEPKVVSVVRVPSVAEEDARRLHRERHRLVGERTARQPDQGAAGEPGDL